MKKLIVSLVSTLICTFSACSLCACNGGETYTQASYSSGGDIIESLTINVTDREIEVNISDNNEIQIISYESEKEYYEIKNDNGALTMELEFSRSWLDFIGTKTDKQYRKIEISIPDNYLTELTIITTNESISVNNLTVKENITLNSNGGNLEFKALSVGNSINLTAKDANITGTLTGGWDDYNINCTIKKGESNIISKNGGEKFLNADCNNGNIQIDFI